MYEQRGVRLKRDLFPKAHSVECNEYPQQKFYQNVINPISNALNDQLEKHCAALIEAGESPSNYVIEYDAMNEDDTLSATIRKRTDKEKIFERHYLCEWVREEE